MSLKYFYGSFFVFFALFIACWLGLSSDFPLSKLWSLWRQGPLSKEDGEMLTTIFFSIRLPRCLLAAFCGGALAAAGVISQGLFRNPLASPSVLGASAGGSLGAVIVFYLTSPWLHWFLLPAGSFLATLLTMVIVLVLSRRAFEAGSSHLLICGFALTTFLSAISSFLMSFMLDQVDKLASLLQWMMGGFNGRSWEHIGMSLPVSSMGLVLAYSLARKLDILALGEELANSLNVDIRQTQQLSIVAIALLVASSVCVAGALPFIGLIVPHITRKITGSKHRDLLIMSVINGMILLLVADTCAQKLFFPREIEVGILTSVIGVLFFFIIFFKKNYE